MPILLADPQVDALIVLFVPPATAGAEDVAEGIARALEKRSADKPVLAALISAEEAPAALQRTPAPAALFTYPESAARALGLAVRRAEWLRRPAGTVPTVEGIDTARAHRRRRRPRSTTRTTPGSRPRRRESFSTPTESRSFPSCTPTRSRTPSKPRRTLGLPVVVKSAVAGAHKTETGGVALNLADEDAVREAATRIGPPVIVQPMVDGGVELLAGVVQDPTFGPLVAFGPGGVLAELIGEAGFRIAPLTDADAEELLGQEKTGLLVAGYRGAPPADPAALTDLIHRLSRLGEDLPEVAELDLNPVIAGPGRLRRRRRPGASAPTRAGCPRQVLVESYPVSCGRAKTTSTLSPS